MIPYPATRPRLRYSSAVKVVFDGNSLVRGEGATTPLPALVAGLPPLAGSGVTVTNLGVDGQTWRMMDGLDGGSKADVDAAFSSSKTNVLVLWETTNAVFVRGRTADQAFGDMRDYIVHRKAAHPDWRIVLLTTLPRQSSSSGPRTQAQLDADNATLVEVDARMRREYRGLGAHAVVDLRSPGSPFRFTGYTPAAFDATAALWSEGSGSRVHLSDAGYALVAGMVANGLRQLLK